MVVIAAIVACTSNRPKTPSPQTCPGDVRASVANGLTVPVDVRVGGQIVGTVSAGAHGDFMLQHDQGVSVVKTDDRFERLGLNAENRKRVNISYACADKGK